MFKTIIFAAVFLGFSYLGFAETTPSASQIEREQEALAKEKGLEEKIYRDRKVFIKKVTLKGASSLGQGQIQEIVSLYQGHWFLQGETETVQQVIKAAYHKEGLEDQPAKVSVRVNRGKLEIDVIEKAH
ncbi:MAG: hypothetical protein PHF11_03410 [Candidatus Omnitrophica bacterium]|nr:hypothetical protein [Candidatus Omnitrophota bacterium]